MDLAPARQPLVDDHTLSLRSAVWAVVFAVVALTGIFWSAASSMVEIWWRSGTFTHGFLIVPISAWLAWRQRDRLKSVAIRPFAPALVGVVLAGFGWLLGDLGSVNAVQHFCFVFAIQFAIVAILGLDAAKVLMFPIAFLLLAVPFGEFLMPVMMDRTADFTVLALRLSGIPIFREGNHFLIPSGPWSVVEACSGVRYLIASFMGGVLFAHLYYRTMYKKVILVLASIALPVVANWVRAYLIVMIGHLSGNELAVGADHLIYGWVFFGLVILLLFWVASFWAEDDVKLAPPLPDRTLAGKGTALTPRATALACIASAGVWPVLALAISTPLPSGTPGLEIPDAIGSWHKAPLVENIPYPRLPGAVAVRAATYVHGDKTVTVHLAYFRRQADGQEVANTDNVIARVDDRKWQIVGERTRPIAWLEHAVPANSTTISSGGSGRRFEAIDFYWVNGHYTNRRSVAKLLVAFSKLFMRGDDAARIVLVTDTAEGAAEARDVIDSFSREFSPVVDKLLATSGAAD